MPFIIGTSIPENRKLTYCVASIYGIGLTQAKALCKKAGFGSDSLGKDLTEIKSKIIHSYVEDRGLPFGSELKRLQRDNIYHLCSISSYRGLRHKTGFPVRGQRTRTNCKKRAIIKFNVSV